MKNLGEYLEHKNHIRHIETNVNGLDMIYRFMRNDEKERLEGHKSRISFDNDMRDLIDIKDKYHISWNELRYIIFKFS